MQTHIIEQLKVKPVIDPQAEIRTSVNFIKNYLIKYPFFKALVLGISGGQDSTLVGKLAQMAIDELNAETDQNYEFIAVRLPYGIQADEQDAMAAIDYIKPSKVVRVDIKPAVDEMVTSLVATGMVITDFNKGNIKARQRMIAQYAVAGAANAAVIGTDHAAEALTGFYTKFGDGAADIMPIWRLNKRQGRQLLQELGAPVNLYQKVPTADLEDDKPELPDEIALGVTYNDIDDYLEGREVSKEAQATIERWFANTEHKRHLPINVYDYFWK